MKASDAKRLANDDTFKEVLELVIERQMEVFLNPNSSTDERDDAHDIVRAIGNIQDTLDTVIGNEMIKDFKTKRR